MEPRPRGRVADVHLRRGGADPRPGGPAPAARALSRLNAGEPSGPLGLFRAASAAGRNRSLGVQTYERKIGLVALVTRIERNKTEVPGAAAARFLRQLRGG